MSPCVDAHGGWKGSKNRPPPPGKFQKTCYKNPIKLEEGKKPWQFRPENLDTAKSVEQMRVEQSQFEQFTPTP